MINECHELRKFIDLYLDDELAADERAHFDAHVQNCQDCDEQLQESMILQKLTSQGLWGFQAPPDLVESVRSSIEHEGARHGRPKTRLRGWLLPAFGSAAAMFSLGLFAMSMLKAPQQSPQGDSVAVQAVRTMPEAKPLRVQGASVPGWLKQNAPSVAAPEFSRSHYRLMGADKVNMDGREVLSLIYGVGSDRFMVQIVPNASARISRAQHLMVNGRNVWVATMNGRNVVTLQDFEGNAYAFVSQDLSRTQLVNLVQNSSLVGH